MKTGLTLDDLTIVHLTQHWVRLHGAWYREAWVRENATGALRFVAIPDEELS